MHTYTHLLTRTHTHTRARTLSLSLARSLTRYRLHTHHSLAIARTHTHIRSLLLDLHRGGALKIKKSPGKDGLIFRIAHPMVHLSWARIKPMEGSGATVTQSFTPVKCDPLFPQIKRTFLVWRSRNFGALQKRNQIFNLFWICFFMWILYIIMDIIFHYYIYFVFPYQFSEVMHARVTMKNVQAQCSCCKKK